VINGEAMKGGAGGVVRSHLAFLAAWSKTLPGISDPFIAELMAFQEGVISARLRGYSHVIIQVDCLELVNLWNSRDNNRSIAAPILEELGDIVLDFASFSVIHVGRTLNHPAHLCARRVAAQEGTESWLDESPSFLISSLRADCNRILVH
jgi:hypothetical protein